MKNLKTKENRRVVWKKLLLVCLAILFIIFITYITGNKRLFNKVSQQKLAENEEMVKIQGQALVLNDTGISVDNVPIEIGYSTGTGPFDLDDEPGNDSSSTNQIVRSFDSVTYRVATGYTVSETVEENIYLYIKAQLPEESQGKIKWKDTANQWGTISADGLNFEGRIQIKNVQDSGIEGKELVASVLGAKNGDKFTPDIYAWIGGENAEVNNLSDYKISNISETTVSAAPKYNIKLATDGGAMQKRETVTLNNTSVEGRMYAATASLQLYNDMCETAQNGKISKGLKGIEIPTGEITFDLDLRMKHDDQVVEDYTPILWNYKLNSPSAEWKMENEAKIYGTKTSYSVLEPNAISQIYNSGTVQMTQNADGKIKVSVNGYSFNEEFPTQIGTAKISDNIGYFSVMYFRIFVPDSEKLQENGTYKLFAQDSNMKAVVRDDVFVTEQKNLEDDEINFVTYEKNLVSKYNHRIEVRDLNNNNLASSYGAGDGTVLLGQEFYGNFIIEVNPNNDNNTEINRIEKFIKFDGDGIQPLLYDDGNLFGQSSVLASNNFNWSVVKYVAKDSDPDGILIWKSEADRNNTIITVDRNNTIITDKRLGLYDSLDALNNAGKTCIGMYLVGTGKIETPSGGSDNYIRIKFKANTDETAGSKSYGITQDDIFYTENGKTIRLIKDQYSKTLYDENGAFIGGHQRNDSNYFFGQTVLIAAAIPSVEKKAIVNNGVTKQNYDLSNEEYEVIFKIKPKLDIQNYNGEPIENATVRLIDTLPNGLNYIGTLTENENVTGPQITKNQDGTTTLIWTIRNCTVGQDIPEIQYKTEIDVTVGAGEQLENRVVIECDKAGVTPIAKRTAVYSINVLGNLSHRLSKKVDEPEIEQNEDINYTLEYLNNTSNNDVVRILDILPYNGDGRNSAFNGTYTLKSMEVTGADGLKVYTTNKDAVRHDTANALISEINSYEWVEETNLSNINKEVKAFAIQGEVDGKDKVTVKFTLSTNGNRGNDVYYNNAIANVASTEIQMQSLITKTIVKEKPVQYGNVIANYYEYGTTNKIANTENLTGIIGTSYETIKKNIDDYEWIETIGNETGLYSEEDKIVNYYYVKNQSINVEKKWEHNNNTFIPETATVYLKADGEIIREINLNSTNEWKETITGLPVYKTGTKTKILYSVTEKNIDNYRVDIDNTIDNTFKLTNRYIGDGPAVTSTITKVANKEEILDETEEIEYTIVYSPKVYNYKGRVRVIITDNLPAEIDESKSNLAGGTYNNEQKTITWNLTYNVNTATDEQLTPIVEKIKLVYKNINTNSENTTVKNKVVGNVTLLDVSGISHQVDDTQDITLDKTPGKIIINYYEVGTTTKLAQSDSSEGKIGTDYTTNAKEIENYDLVTTPENANGKYRKEEQIINYYYTKKKGNLVVQYVEKSTGNKLLDDKKSTEEIGKTYETKEENIAFYKLIEKTDNTKGTYKLGEQKVTYYYEKMRFNLAVTKEIDSIKLNGENIKTDKKLGKVELDKNDFQSTNLEVIYKLTVKNTGDIAGTCTLFEKIPEGFIISDSSKTKWSINKNNIAQIQVEELQPGEEKTYEISLKWDNAKAKFGSLKNNAKIEEFQNEADFNDMISEDNQDTAEFIVTVKTGTKLSTLATRFILVIMLIMIISINLKFYYTKKRIK